MLFLHKMQKEIFQTTHLGGSLFGADMTNEKKEGDSMVEATSNLVGCRTQIKDMETNELIANTKIIAYDPVNKILTISGSGMRYRGDREVSLLVFYKDDIFEYFGNLRKPLVSNEFEICLYRGKKKEGRSNKRYDIVAKGRVKGIEIEGQRVELRKPIEITTKNISANGLLIESMAGSFERKDRIWLDIDYGEAKIRGVYEVVRLQNQNLWTEEYGCRHIGPKKKA